MKLERVITNIAGTVQQKSMGGRKYLVAPVVLMTEGVFTGNNGPVYYPAKEIEKSQKLWNHKPIVIGHPDEHRFDTACTPEVLDETGVGMLLNVNWDSDKGKLRGEAWLEVDRLNVVDPMLLNAIKKNEITEVSTGLRADVSMTNGEWSGKDYEGVANNHKPDHLAILLDFPGACSVADGAGLLQLNEGKDGKAFRQLVSAVRKALTEEGVTLNNEDPSMSTKTKAEKDNDRKAAVDALIADKDSHWAEDDRTFLMNASDDQLKKLTPKAPEGSKGKETPPAGDNTDDKTAAKGAQGDNPDATADDKKGEATPATKTDAVVTNKEEPKAPVSIDEYINNAPPEIGRMLRRSLQIEKDTTEKLIGVIMQNKANQFSVEELREMNPTTLERIASMAGHSDDPQHNYVGQGADLSLMNRSVPQDTLGLPDFDAYLAESAAK